MTLRPVARTSAILVGLLLVLGHGAFGVAAQSVTAADLERLRSEVFEASTDLSRLRTGDAALLKTLRSRLDGVRTRLAALDAQQRESDGAPVRAEYLTIRDEIRSIRRTARSELTVTGAGLPPAAPAPGPSSIARVGLDLPRRTELSLRLLTGVNPISSRPEDRVEAAVLDDLVIAGRLVVPAGSLLRGTVKTTSASSKRTGALTVRFDSLTVGVRTYPISAALRSAVGDGLIAGTIVRALVK